MDFKKTFIETLPFLILCALGGASAGFILGNMSHVLAELPGLIAIVPALIALRGNISSTMGSRLGSAFHLGLIEGDIGSSIVIDNLKSSIVLSLYVSVLLPVFYSLTAFLFGFPLDYGVVSALLLISVSTGLTSGAVLALFTFFIVHLSIRWKIDPDNVTGPILTTFGDVMTLLILFTYAVILGGVL